MLEQTEPLKVVIIALSARGALGQYIDAMVPPIAERADVHLFVPKIYDGSIGKALLHSLETGKTRKQAFLSLINPYLGWRLWQQIAQIQPDVIHIFSGSSYPWIFLGAKWAKLQGIPMTLTVHDPEPHPGSLLNIALSYADKITMSSMITFHIHSRCFINTMVQQGIPQKKLFIIPHGSLAKRFLRHRRTDVAQEPLALFFGRLEAYKGIDVLVSASLRLKGKLRVAIAGPGTLPDALYQSIADHPEIFELYNRYLSEAEVANLFQRAAVCVLPYKQATQSSLPLIAAAFGVPVVATAVGGFVEDVPLVGGHLVAPNDSSALAEGILQALGKSVHCPEDYTFESLSEQFIALYRQTVHANMQ